MRTKQYTLKMTGRMSEYISGRISGIIAAVSRLDRRELGHTIGVVGNTYIFTYDANAFQYRRICKMIKKLYSHMFEIAC